MKNEVIDILYAEGILGTETPQAVINTLWLNNMLHFSLRGTLEQYNFNGLRYLEQNAKIELAKT